MKIIFNLNQHTNLAVYKIFQHDKRIASRRPFSKITSINIDPNAPIEIQMDLKTHLKIDQINHNSILLITWNKVMRMLWSASFLFFLASFMILAISSSHDSHDFNQVELMIFLLTGLVALVLILVKTYYRYSRKSAYTITDLSKDE